MKYWGLLAAKSVAAAVILGAVWMGITWLLPPPHLYRGQYLFFDPSWILAAGFTSLLSGVLVYLCILDQRYRCRVCARRLRMPVLIGSWGQMLQLGRPRVEYICPYGHGTLRVEELQICGLEPANWERHGDMWEELLSHDKHSS